MKRISDLPQSIENLIEQVLADQNIKLNQSRLLANHVLRLSDFFIKHPNRQTPWENEWAQIAYLVYFFPLNYVRVNAILEEIHRFNFFKGISTVLDFGSGPGTAGLALHEKIKLNTFFCEKSPIPGRLVRPHSAFLDGSRWVHRIDDLKEDITKQSLVIFSYSLTEMKVFPRWALNSEALLIIEPSTQEDGRRLLTLREFLIKNGYQIYAPCVHQEFCPLQYHSKKDWCHDRVRFNRPDWFRSFEENLPMKNQSITMSYLFARKTPISEINLEFVNLFKDSTESPRIGRTIGDQLVENGKIKQLFCRNSEREFLVWLSKHNHKQEIDRGVLVKLPEKVEKKSNEIRVQSNLNFITDI